MLFFRRLLRYLLIFTVVCVVLGCAAIGVVYWLIAPRLPSVESLRDVTMQVPMRVYSADNKLIATFGETRRIPVKIEQVPDQVKKASSRPRTRISTITPASTIPASCARSA